MNNLIKDPWKYILLSVVVITNRQTAEKQDDDNDDDVREINVAKIPLQDSKVRQTTSGAFSTGISGIKWIAGTTYSISAGVAGSAVATVSSLVGAVSSGASAVVSRVTKGTPKEHKD